jgi:FkbM family methyltransferase
MILKRLLARLLAFGGYEIRKKGSHGGRIPELAGLAFHEFLHCYLMGRNLSNFFVIQVGANNGLSNDVIHECVVKFRLKGILVEPQAASFRELATTYRTCDGLILENVALSHENGAQALYTIKKDLAFLQYANQAASFDYQHVKKELKRHLRNGASAGVVRSFKALRLTVDDCIEAETVKTCTFQSLLEKHGVSSYDFLQIDAEGFDYEVIKMAMIDKFRPLVVNYEHEHLTDRDNVECWDYLRRQSYNLFTHQGNTTGYLLEDEQPGSGNATVSSASVALR